MRFAHILLKYKLKNKPLIFNALMDCSSNI
jgi:hypothetical protein